MHWLVAKFLAERRSNRNLAFLARTSVGDMLAYELAKIGFIIDSMTFKYRRKITITEQSGSDLTDYQVLIELNSTNFDFTHAQTNGEDIRFTDANGNLLPYWIEEYDPVNETACYSEDTDILTEKGWMPIKDLVEKRLKIKVATLNPKTHKVEYHYPLRYFKYYYSGKMFHHCGQQIDVLVTPNHLMYVRRATNYKKSHNEGFEFIEAQTMPKHVEYNKDFPWEGEEKQFFILPGIRWKDSLNRSYHKPEMKIPMDDWLRFFGAWLSEGGIHKSHYKVYISQKKDSEKIRKIGEWIKKCGFNGKYIKSTKTYEIYNKQLYSYLERFGKAKDKFIPQEIKNLSKRQLRILLSALILGDGTIDRNNYKEEGEKWKFYTSSRRLADDVQEIAIKAGYVANIYTNKDWGKSLGYKNKVGYVVNITKRRKTPQMRKEAKYVEYDGYVYCIEVPNHLIYVRRRGKPCWCGNSIWVKVPSIPANGTVEIWMYYGNPRLASASNGEAVFDFFDDFTYPTWSPIANLPAPRAGGGTFVINGYGYYVGGTGPSRATYKYDPSTNSWTQVADLPEGLTNLRACTFACNGYGYVMTGDRDSELGDTDHCYKYDPVNDVWTSLPDFPGGVRSDAAGFVIGTKIYIGLGNCDVTGNDLKDWYVFDTETETWAKLSDFPGTEREEAMGFAIGGYGYICGGEHNETQLTDCWRYDPDTDTWTQVASLPIPLEEAAAFVIGDYAYVAGGSSQGSNDPQVRVFRYDPSADKWDEVTSLPEARTSPGSFVIGDYAYIVGGYLTEALDTAYKIHKDDLNKPAFTAKWNEGGDGTRTISNSVVRIEGSAGYAKHIDTKTFYSRPCVLEVRMRSADANWVAVCLSSSWSPVEDRCMYLDNGSDVWRTFVNGTEYDKTRTVIFDVWRRLTIKYSSTAVQYIVDGNLDAEETEHIPTRDMQITIGADNEGVWIEVDWCAIRKFASVEPSVSIRAEETA